MIKAKVVGVAEHDKKDFLAGCNDPKTKMGTDPEHFQKIWCRRCRNEYCVRSKGSQTPWHWRMEHQPEYLLNNPEFSDLSTDDHKRINAITFKDIHQKLQKLEIQQDTWQPLDQIELPSDGVVQVQDRDTTREFDVAAEALAKARGKTKEFPDPDLPEDTPVHFQEPEGDDPEEEILFETEYASKTSDAVYRVWLDKDRYWHCTCPGFKHKGRCKHVDDVDEWLSQQSAREEEPPTEEPPPPREPREPMREPPKMNTNQPSQGLMVGGGPVPPNTRAPSRVIQADDPWSIRTEQKVKPGAKIVLKGNE